MKRLLATVGIFTLLPSSALAAAPSLYDAAQEMVRKELMLDENLEPHADEDVARFASELIPKGDPPWKKEEMDDVLRKKFETLCGKTPDHPSVDIGRCAELMENVTNTMRKEETLRALGRELQGIASSYELAIDGYPGRETTLPSRYASLTLLWQAGQKKGDEPGKTRIRMFTLPKDDAWKKNVSAIEDMVGQLSGEERTGAVWRYQHGVRYVQGKRGDFPLPKETDPAVNGPGTERQYLSKRWDGTTDEHNLEAVLTTAWETLLTHLATMDAPLQRGDVVFFPAIPLGDVIGWAYVETCKDAKNQTFNCVLARVGNAQIAVTGDIGLQWSTPLDPVQPGLITDPESACEEGDPDCPAILGGLYPPPPEDGSGLCTFPFARAGYLCRPLEGENVKACENAIERTAADEDKIILTECISGVRHETEQGPNVCRDVLWQSSPTTAACEASDVEISCGPCESIAFASKREAGHVKVCLQDNFLHKGEPVDAKYFLMHELVHAQELVTRETLFYANAAQCCAKEKEANRFMCEAMQKDGVFEGTSMTAETCAQTTTNGSCVGFGENVCFPKTPDSFSVILDQLQKTDDVKGCTPGVPPDLSDPRIQALLHGTRQLSRAQCETTYANTIGNNMCYIGQMMEESMEQHRLIPGRTPFTTGDEQYPWDACAAPDPMLATFMTPPPRTLSVLPVYNPAALIKEFDEALCQLNGLPAHSLPVECATDASRRLSAILSDYLQNATSLIDQAADQESTVDRLQALSTSVGTRLGTMFYVRYLKQASRALTEVTQTASELLEDLSGVTFTQDSCPRNGATNKLIDHPSCPVL